MVEHIPYQVLLWLGVSVRQGMIIFIGLTAWDVQKIKQMAMETSERNVGKLLSYQLAALYLDFINLFLYLLRIFGKPRLMLNNS